jgi:hypothetical protein
MNDSIIIYPKWVLEEETTKNLSLKGKLLLLRIYSFNKTGTGGTAVDAEPLDKTNFICIMELQTNKKSFFGVKPSFFNLLYKDNNRSIGVEDTEKIRNKKGFLILFYT